MVKIIDPNSLSQHDAKNLLNFFQAQSRIGIHAWKKGNTYTFGDNTTFEFAENVIQRNSTKNKSQVRYEFISSKLIGKGSYGSIYEITGTLALEPGKIRFKQAGYKDKTRVVKIQHHNLDFPTQRAQIEYELSKKAHHLAIKEPTIEGLTSYTVMRKLRGRELSDIINDDIAGLKPLSLNQRIDLTKALVNALKEQVSNYGIIHRDMKGENILVDLNDPLSVNIIDYGLSVIESYPDGRHPGTPAYAAPEIWHDLEQTVKADVFSMARVIALLWHVDPKSYNFNNKLSFQNNADHVSLDSLFIGLPEVDHNSRIIIKTTLENMVIADHASRYSVEQAIAGFVKLKHTNAINTPPQLSQKSIIIPIMKTPSQILVMDEVLLESKKRIAEIIKQIKQLNIKVEELRSRKEYLVADNLDAVATKLKESMLSLQKMDSEEYGKNILTTIKECQNIIHDNRKSFESNRNDKYIWANIALGIAGLGLIYFAALYVYQKNTGNTLFFSKTRTASMVETVEKSMDSLEKEGQRLQFTPI